MIDLLKEMFELRVKWTWMKQIEKAVDRYNRLNRKAAKQGYAAKKLMERYNEIYGPDAYIQEGGGSYGT